ncbi:hypothetical protein L9F63_025402, partial [Diploptera punctata]
MAAVVDQTPTKAEVTSGMFSPTKEPCTPHPVDYSSIRTKTALISPNEKQFDLLQRRLKERLEDGRGETIFDVGLEKFSSYGYASISSNNSGWSVAPAAEKKEEGVTGQYLVRRRVDQQDFLEIRVAVVGNVDAGKSTLLGVLTHGELDNGRGHARQRLFRHKHEMESGRTSSVGNDILGFDSMGNVVNKPEHGSLDWVKICEKSSKVITFIDLAGHERYLKTTVFGMTGHAPDFGMLM